MPIFSSVGALSSVKIGGVSTGSYGCMSVTELDSHANMAVAGKDCTIISRSGQYANVTPFSSDLPMMERVEIGNVAMAYDCPYTGRTYLLFMPNSLLIESMDHNLIPPFLIREASLFLDETPKFQSTNLSQNNHTIYDEETGMRIHLQLSGTFSYFPTRKLTAHEEEHCDDYPIVFLTPDSDRWDPQSSHYAEQEAAMIDHEGDIAQHDRKMKTVFNDADIAEMYAETEPCTWQFFEDVVDAIFLDNDPNPFVVEPVADDDEDDETKLNNDGIRAQLASLSVVHEPSLLSAAMSSRASISHLSMAVGSTTYNDESCEVFESMESMTLRAQADATVPIWDINASSISAGRSTGVTPEHLSKIWRIPFDDAVRTLETTTQLIQQDPDSSLSRSAGTNDRAVRYRKINSTFYTDTMFATKKAVSLRGNTCCQFFASDKDYVAVSCMKKESEYLYALKEFSKEVGAPDVLICDGSKAQNQRAVKLYCNQIGTTLKTLEAETQFANRAELIIGLFKEATRKDMRESGSPIVLWDFCIERRAVISQATSKKLFQLHGSNPHTATFGTEADISNLCHFGWYEWVYYRDKSASYPFQKECLGRCLGPAKNEGNVMANWVLNQQGKVIPRRSLRRLTKDEQSQSNEVEVAKRAAFTADITSKLGDSIKLPTTPLPEMEEPDWNAEPYGDDETETPEPFEADLVDAAGKPIMMHSLTDALINAEVLLSKDEATAIARVVRRSVDSSGKVIGEWNANPIMNTLVYDCEFDDGTVRAYAANQIASNIYEEGDADGYSSSLLNTIVEHKSSGEAIKMKDKYFQTRSGTKRMRQTTVGWSFLVQWGDGSRQWVDLKVLKESNPVQVGEYVIARGLQDEPAFAWWVPYTMRKRDIIVSAVKARVRRTTHKYGIEMPAIGRNRDEVIQNATELDKKNGNTLWMDSLALEMGNLVIAFEIKEHGEKAPPGWHKASGHVIFDVKMDFTRKARWVKDGHKTPDSTTSSYAGVVSRESIRIALTYAALLGLPVIGGDLKNAYLQAPSSEKHFIICGPEFGIENVGKVALIRRALYGGKVAGRDFWHHLRECMGFLGFTSSLADPDVWLRLSKRSTGEEYYEYVLLYVDDVLVISERAEAILRKEIGKYWEIKEGSIGPPTKYLGGKLREVELANGTKAWAFGSHQYVCAAVKNVQDHLDKKGLKLPYKAPNPLSTEYRPEIDVTPELGEADASYYHTLIGVLRWIVELGRIDIDVEVSMMSSHLALPREGHLKELYHIFAYLKAHSNAEMVFDPTPIEPDMSLFVREDWSYSAYGYESLKEELPVNMPVPHGKPFTIRVFVDADHAGDLVTRRSRTGFIVFLNNAPIYWSSKKQSSVETSTFGSEFVAMKQATEYVRGLRYKLRMMGILVDEPAFVFGDNQSVLCNTTMPGSTLKKKNNAIAYHHVREGVARDEWRTAYVNTDENVADLLTKPLSGPKRWKFVRMVLHHIYPEKEI